MSNSELQIGSVIRIPHDGTESTLAVVLFISRVFRNVMLLGLPFEVTADMELTDGLSGTTRALVYTSVESVSAGRWPIVDTVPLRGTEALTERIDGSSVWVLDEKTRQATGEDRAVLPIMRVAGEGVVESLSSQLGGKQDLSKYTKLILRQTDSLLERIRESSPTSHRG